MTRAALLLSIALLAAALPAAAELPDHAAGHGGAVGPEAEEASAHPTGHDAASHPGGCPMAAATSGHGAPSAGPLPTAPGQAAFGALAEIVGLLEADPATDWKRVSIARLREHLRDMDEVVLGAEVVERAIEGGVEAEVTGSGRTLDAIRRMVPAHAAMLRAERPWTIEVEELPAGVLLRVTAQEPEEAAKLRGLGFFGLLVSGDHHRPHHLAMARGS